MDREPEEFHTNQPKEELTALVEDITTGARSLADSVCTRDTTRERIYEECNNVQEALSNLLDEYSEHVSILLFVEISISILFVHQR